MRYERSKRTRPAPTCFARGLPFSGLKVLNCWAPPMMRALMTSGLCPPVRFKAYAFSNNLAAMPATMGVEKLDSGLGATTSGLHRPAPETCVGVYPFELSPSQVPTEMTLYAEASIAGTGVLLPLLTPTTMMMSCWSMR